MTESSHLTAEQSLEEWQRRYGRRNDPSQMLHEGFGKHGLTIEGLPDDLTREQAIEFCERFLDALRAKGAAA